jgi:flavin reductase (DIM6/NTAB) family NADH-FMN oxidoreductase RutF
MPAIIVTAVCKGRRNAMAAAWHCSVSMSPPLYGVALAPKRFTCEAIAETGGFAVNFVPLEQARLVAQVGGVSGRDADKFERFGIASAPGAVIAAPILESAFAAYECRMHTHPVVGDHEFYVGEVVRVHVEEKVDEGGKGIRLDRARMALYLGKDRYGCLDPSTVTRHERGK